MMNIIININYLTEHLAYRCINTTVIWCEQPAVLIQSSNCFFSGNLHLACAYWKILFSWAAPSFYTRNIKNSALVMLGWFFFSFSVWWTDEEQHDQRKYSIQRPLYNLSLDTTTQVLLIQVYISQTVFSPLILSLSSNKRIYTTF